VKSLQDIRHHAPACQGARPADGVLRMCSGCGLLFLQAAAVQELVSSGALPDSAADSSCLLAPLAGVMSNGLLDLMKGEQSICMVARVHLLQALEQSLQGHCLRAVQRSNRNVT
jgi:hypothetical protein